MYLKKTNYSVLFLIVSMSPLLSLLFDNTTFYNYLAPIIAIILCMISIFEGKVVNILFVFLSIFSLLIGLFNSVDSGKIYIHFFSFINTVLLFLLFSDVKVIERFKIFFKKYKLLLISELLVIWIVEFILILTHKGYMYRFSWGGSFFLGTSQMPHTLAYLMMMTIIIFLCVLINDRKRFPYYFILFIPFLAIYLSGARVVLLAALGISLILIDYLFTSRSRSIMLKLFVFFLITMIFLFIFRKNIINSNLWQKMMLRENSGNNSAGRLYMIKYMIPQFLSDSNLLHILFGQGDDKTYLYNLENIYVASPVWAHDDLLQVLIGKGIMGLLVYMYSFLRYIKFVFSNNSKYIEIILSGVIVILLLINGFYTYRDASLGIPFISLLLILYNGRGDESKNV